MPAPNLEALFAFEDTIETAWKTILTTSPASLNAQAEFSDGERTWPRVDLQLREATLSPAGAPHKYVKPSDKSQWFDRWEGTLVSTVCTVRGKNSDQQPSIIGKIRSRALQWPSLFSVGLLPYHMVVYFEEHGFTRGVDPETREDKSELRHKIIWEIRSTAWPA